MKRNVKKIVALCCIIAVFVTQVNINMLIALAGEVWNGGTMTVSGITASGTTATLKWDDPSLEQPFGTISDYSLFVFGNHSANSGDSEGPVFIKGNGTYNMGYIWTVGAPHNGVGFDYYKNIPGGKWNPAVVVGGRILSNGGGFITPFNGKMVIGENTKNQSTQLPGMFDGALVASDSNINDFTNKARNSIISQRDYLRTLSTKTYTANSSVNIDLAGVQPVKGNTYVVTVDASAVPSSPNWEKGTNIKITNFQNIEQSNLIINVVGNAKYFFAKNQGVTINGTMCGFAQSRDWAPSILWNISDETTEMEFYENVPGSVIAPNTNITAKGANINGNAIVKNLDAVNSFQTHTMFFKWRNSSNVLTVMQQPEQEITYSLHFTKKDGSTNNALAGAGFTLYKEASCTTALGTSTSDVNGRVSFSGLKKDTTYYMKETTIPAGYGLNTKVYTISVSATGAVTLKDGSTAITSISNTKTALGELTFYKIDKLTGNGLTGATFTLYSNEACTTVVKTATSNSIGKVIFHDLTLGKTYYLKETIVPAGYASNSKKYEVIVSATGVVTLKDGSSTINNIENIKITGKLIFENRDLMTQNLLSGSQFTLYSDINCTNQVKQTMSATGKVEFADLEVGKTYYMKQTIIPAGYKNNSKIYEVFVSQTGGVILMESANIITVVENEKIVGKLSFIKKDKNSGDALAGAEFTLYSDSSCATVLKIVTTGTDGKVEFTNLEVPKTYYMKETKVPTGYENNLKIYSASVLLNGDVTLKDGTTTITAIENVKKLGTFVVTTKDKETDFVLAGAEYTLYSNEACTTVVSKTTSDAIGKAVFNHLEQGKTYYLKETKVPAGYENNAKTYTVNVSSTGDIVLKDGTTTITTVYNIQKVGSLIFLKKDKMTSNVLQGAEFTLYSNAACTTVVKKATSGIDGKVAFTDLSINKTYYMKETKEPSGYMNNTKIYTVEVPSTGNDVTLKDGTATITMIDNIKNTNKLAFLTTDKSTGSVLEGAEYTLYSNSACTIVVKTAVTEVDGKVEFKDLPAATTYYMKETKVPAGYEDNTKIYTIVISQLGDTVALKDGAATITNIQNEKKVATIPTTTQQSATVTIKTVDNHTEKGLAGAEYTLYADANCTIVIAKEISESDGVVTFKNLENGTTYYLKETKVPTGYETNNTKYTVTVSEKGDTTIKQGATAIKNISNTKKETGDLIFTITDETTGDSVSGVEYTLYSDPECTNEIGKTVTDDDGKIIFTGLDVDTIYYMKLTGKSSEYADDTAVYEVSISKDGTIKLQTDGKPVNKVTSIQNGKSTKINTLPKTGDKASNMTYVYLVYLCSILALIVVVYHKKIKKMIHHN